MSKMEFGYDLWQANPSEEVALPHILSVVFNEGAECYWMSQRSYQNEEMFAVAEELYRRDYPELFRKLSAFSVIRANSMLVSEHNNSTMNHYYRGATIAIRALEASSANNRLSDLTVQYTDTLSALDMIDLEHWMNCMTASTVKQTEQLRGFIEAVYQILNNEPSHLKSAMQIGARYTYILLAHHQACLYREAELAWAEHDDSKSIDSQQ